MINYLKLEHFKAFRDSAELDLADKNVLIFGENGAGKSSLYQALKLIFHRQLLFDNEGISAITDPNERLRAETDFLAPFNHQKFPLVDFNLEINHTNYKTFATAGYDVSMISREDLRGEDQVDVVSLLERSFVGIANVADFVRDKKTLIETAVNSFLKNSFCEDNLQVTLTYSNPRWLLTVKDSSRDNSARNEHLTDYFNEAKLHTVKMLLMMTAILSNGAEARGDQRVLVLDDVFTSMDAANRMLFMEFLKDNFADYQKIVMTHSISFFNLADYTFTTAYGQKNQWLRYQIVEHDGDSKIVPRDSQDFAKKIKGDYRAGRNEGVIGNRIRKRFEFLAGEISKLIYAGGVGESGQMLGAIMAPKKLYYEFDRNTKKLNTVYNLVDELTAIIDADPGSALKTNLNNVIARYVSGPELGQLRDTLCELMVYQKVTMHPLSHATGAAPLATQREVDRSITLLMMLESQLGSLIERDYYTI